MAECWRPVRGEPGYEASDRCRVRSVDRHLTDGRRAGGMVLSPHRDRKGYLRYRVNGRTRCLHTLVALAWLPPPRRGCTQVRHLDGDKDNCCPWNLRWGDQRQQEWDKRQGRGRENRTGKQDQDGIRTGAYRARTVGTPGT